MTSGTSGAVSKKYRKIIKTMDKRDKDPLDNRSNRQILREFGYSDKTRTKEVVESVTFQRELAQYYKKHERYEDMMERLAAKARRNLDEGMDSENDKTRIEYTKLQLKQEQDIASRSKLEMKDADGNMMTLMGWGGENLNALEKISFNPVVDED